MQGLSSSVMKHKYNFLERAHQENEKHNEHNEKWHVRSSGNAESKSPIRSKEEKHEL